MKYGVIFFNKTSNLGDDIQTYAAMRQLPKVDYVIERENLSTFTPMKNELVTTIMSGWYNHDVTELPPSPFLNTLIISAHFTDHLKNEMPEYFDDYFLKYLKEHEPVGLRDDLVKKYLDNRKIQNYFSGCLALTIRPFSNTKTNNKICLIDVDDDIYERLKKKTNYSIDRDTHDLNPKINSKLTFEERMNNVENKLKKYQSYRLIITSRLHVALPCLSIGVPVLLIYNESNLDVKNRLGKYVDLLNYISKEKFLKEININIKNKDDYLIIRKQLESQISKFLVKSQKLKMVQNDDIYFYNKYYCERKKHIDNIIKYQLDEKDRQLKKMYEISKYNKLESLSRYELLVGLKQRIFDLEEQLNLITTSKGYLLLEFIRKILRKIKRIIKR